MRKQTLCEQCVSLMHNQGTHLYECEKNLFVACTLDGTKYITKCRKFKKK